MQEIPVDPARHHLVFLARLSSDTLLAYPQTDSWLECETTSDVFPPDGARSYLLVARKRDERLDALVAG